MLQQIPNPTNNVEAVSTGYQRQNTNLFILQTGLDTTEPYDNGQGVITIPAGGVVDVNGVLYKLINDVVLNKPSGRNDYVYFINISIDENDSTIANAILSDRPGYWNSEKKGSYLSDTERVLNWASTGSLVNYSANTLPMINRWNKKGFYNYMLKPGFYLISLKSGLGRQPTGLDKSQGDGNDGTYTTSPSFNYSHGGGGIPDYSAPLDFVIFYSEPKIVNIKIGGSGLNGVAGRSTNAIGNINAAQYYPAGGGGCGGGEETVFDGISTGDVEAGRGGRAYLGSQLGSTQVYEFHNVSSSPGSNGTIGRVTFRILSRPGDAYFQYDVANGILGGLSPGMFSGGGGNGSSSRLGDIPTNQTFTVNNMAYAGDGGISGHLRELGTDGGICEIRRIEI